MARALTGNSCITGQFGQWANQPIAQQTGSFTFDFDASPTANNADAVVGLVSGTASYYNLAANIRFNNVGKIDARSGISYWNDSSILYSAGVVYHFHMAIDLPNHRYSAWVTPAGQARQLLASGYLFRAGQTGPNALDDLAATVDPQQGSGTVDVCNPVIGPPEPVEGCTSATRGGAFVTSPLPEQTGSFVLDFNVYTDASLSDEVMGLVKGTATGYSSLAANVRFNDDWVVDVRKGGAYAVEAHMFYGGHWLHYRMAVDVPSHTYSVWGWDQSTTGKPVITLATNFPFRTEQQAVTSLNGLTHFVDPGAFYQTTNTICGAIVSH